MYNTGVAVQLGGGKGSTDVHDVYITGTAVQPDGTAQYRRTVEVLMYMMCIIQVLLYNLTGEAQYRRTVEVLMYMMCINTGVAVQPDGRGAVQEGGGGTDVHDVY